MASIPSRPAGSQESSLNAPGSRENPVVLNDDDDHVDEEQTPSKGRDSDNNSEYDKPLRQRFASESTLVNQEPQENLRREAEGASRVPGDRPALSVSIHERQDVHGKTIRQAWFMEDDRTRYKMNVANSFGSRKELQKLRRDWATWNTKELANDIAFLKYLRGSKKARGTTKKEKKTLKKKKATQSKKT